MNKDHVSTLAGGGAGLYLLSTVKWEAIPQGELVKLGMVLVMWIVGYKFYRDTKPVE